MKTKYFYLPLLALLCTVCGCSNDDDESDKDLTYPEISDQGITANPIDCQVYHRGEVIPVRYILMDNQELGAYNIEIHHNFDHHSHSTSHTDCPQEAKKEPVEPWVFNLDYLIPAGMRKYGLDPDILIPSDIDTGDYHFMIRLTDRAGWQQLRAVALKIME